MPLMETMIDEKYLQADDFIDYDQEKIADFVMRTIDQTCRTPAEKAVSLYYAVRDQILYDPYTLSDDPVDYRASNILAKQRGFCVQKAVLLCALTRAAGIPARLGFATVTNHLASRKLMQFIGDHVFVFHGYTELWLDERWIKVTPAFNAELCSIYNVPPLEFNGQEDALFQAYNSFKKPFMEYTSYQGSFATVPLRDMLDAWKNFYGVDRVHSWFDNRRTTEINQRAPYIQEDPFKTE